MTAVTPQPATFFTVRYGANDQQLFNSDCYLRLLINSIMSKCNCEDYVEGHDQLALLNEAEYSIIELAQFSQSLENGRSVFTGRGSYVLLSIDKSDKEKPQYKSLLDLPYLSRELTEKLDEYSNPSRPKSRTRRATMGSSSLGKQIQKRRPSVPISKKSPMKKINPAPSIAE